MIVFDVGIRDAVGVQIVMYSDVSLGIALAENVAQEPQAKEIATDSDDRSQRTAFQEL